MYWIMAVTAVIIRGMMSKCCDGNRPDGIKNLMGTSNSKKDDYIAVPSNGDLDATQSRHQ